MVAENGVLSPMAKIIERCFIRKYSEMRKLSDRGVPNTLYTLKRLYISTDYKKCIEEWIAEKSVTKQRSNHWR